jgi:hypothetical protein
MEPRGAVIPTFWTRSEKLSKTRHCYNTVIYFFLKRQQRISVLLSFGGACTFPWNENSLIVRGKYINYITRTRSVKFFCVLQGHTARFVYNISKIDKLTYRISPQISYYYNIMWTINIIIHNIGSTLLPHLHKHTVSAVHLQTYIPTACEFIAPVTIIYYSIILW